MKYVFHTLILLLILILQSTWLKYITFFGIVPNLFLVYIVIVSSYCKRKEALVLGFIVGIVLDLLIGQIIGLNAVLMMILAFFTDVFYTNMIRNNTLLISLALVAIATLIYEVLYYIVAFLGDLQLNLVLIRILLPECLVSVASAVPVYFAVKKCAKALWDDKGEEIG